MHIKLSAKEIQIFKNSILLILSELDPYTFETRVGVTRQEAKDIYQKELTGEFSENEELLINNALNEVLNGLHIEPFETLIGAKEQEVETLFKKLRQLSS